MNPFKYYLDEVAQDSGYATYEEYFSVALDTLLGRERLDALNRMNAEAADRWARQDLGINTVLSNGVKVNIKHTRPLMRDDGCYSGEEAVVSITPGGIKLTHIKNRFKEFNHQLAMFDSQTIKAFNRKVAALNYCVRIGKGIQVHDEYINIDIDIMNAYIAGNENS